jgi:N-acetyl-gamma-glutamyl-phosphate/LysW-gamma-L-alpha-aminoadipyl-6-phosphate reductase
MRKTPAASSPTPSTSNAPASDGRPPAAPHVVRAAIVGGTGYGGMELLRFLVGHPTIRVTAITSRTETGAVGDVHPHLRGLVDVAFTQQKATDLAQTNDLLFFAAPHGVSAKETPAVLAASPTVKVVDLSGDFRLRDDTLYPAAYGWPHPAPAWLAKAAYGLPECGGRRTAASKACRLVANPGCHASATTLALYPFAKAGLLPDRVSVASVTGSSGSGAQPKQGTHHPERFGNFKAYKPLEHQHLPEIRQSLVAAGAKNPRIAFVPFSGPFSRGILATAFLPLGDDAARAADLVRTAYAQEPFVRLVPESAEVRAVAGTNFADIAVVAKDGVACVTVAIDNLGKGMAGTAVQNANLLCGLGETTNLLRPGNGL